MGVENSIRVMIVDDHEIVRRGLVTLLEVTDGLEAVGSAQDGRQAVSLCSQLQPDVILMDLMMPEMDGVTAIKEIKKAYPHTKILALTTYVDQALIQAALQAGAIGYLLKRVTAQELASAVRAANKGNPTLDPEAAKMLIQATTTTHKPDFHLTKRELEVLGLLVRGLSNHAVAAELNISLYTAKNHVSGILSKMGVESRTEAVILALDHKLVEV